jgi:hypothetical protein
MKHLYRLIIDTDNNTSIKNDLDNSLNSYISEEFNTLKAVLEYLSLLSVINIKNITRVKEMVSLIHSAISEIDKKIYNSEKDASFVFVGKDSSFVELETIEMLQDSVDN